MVEVRYVVNDGKTGKTFQKAIEDEALVGKRIGDKISGDFLGLEGYELEIKGGSDFAGFPLRKDIEGPVRKRILAGTSVGVNVNRPGMKIRKTVCGNTITVKTAQVNLKVVKYGHKALDELLGKKEEAKAE